MPNPFQPLNSDDFRAVTRLFHELKRGDGLTRERMRELAAQWEPKVRPDAKERGEDYAVAKPDGTTTGVVGPRWLFHLLGLRHRAAEIALRTPSGLIVLQRRSATKIDWPDVPDMAVVAGVPAKILRDRDGCKS